MSDFPDRGPWSCLEMAQNSKYEEVFRFPTIKEIRNSAKSGCHVCAMWCVSLQKSTYSSTIRDEDSCELTIYRNPYDWALKLSTDKLSVRLLLSQATENLNRTVFGEAIWDMGVVSEFTKTRMTALQPLSSTNTGHRAIPQIKDWLRVCETEHEQCRIKTGSEHHHAKSFRLIHVGTDIHPTVRLVSTHELGHLPRYTTLSHRWTTVTQATQLTWKNLGARLVSIQTDAWPKIYRQALSFTQQLGIQYIWIDSMCIVQDSRDDLPKQDWDEQATLMDYIYTNGVMNLAGFQNENFDGFTATRNLLTEAPCVLTRNSEPRTHYLCSVEHHNQNAVDLSPLANRGWIFQERLLSRRAVHFGYQLYWECPSLRACEVFPTGFDRPLGVHGPRVEYARDFKQTFKATLLEPQVCNYEKTVRDLHNLWGEILSMYSKTNLTMLSDRLIALRGIVNALLEHYRLPETSYAAGIWQPCLPVMLVWRSSKKHTTTEEARSRRQTLLQHFPSWSWASSDGPVGVGYSDYSYHANLKHLVKITSMQGTDDRLRTIDHAYIHLHGWVFQFDQRMIKQQDTNGSLETYVHLEDGTCDAERTVRIFIDWDGPATSPIESLALLPIFHEVGNVKGLVLEHVATNDKLATYVRLGSFEGSMDIHPYNAVLPLHGEDDCNQRVELAPLVRLV